MATPVEENISAVQYLAIKAPTFMETAVMGWFQIMEAQFYLRKITTDETKFYHVLSALPAETVGRLSEPILIDKNYISLKAEVIDMFEKTKPELFEKLISNTPMTGRPSIYLEEIRKTATKVGVGGELVRHKFIQSLPSAISPVLAAQKDLSISQIGKLADELMPFVHNTVNEVTSYPVNNAHPNNNSTKINKASTHIPFGLRPFGETQKPQVCRAHIYFGAKAKYCKPWCKWPEKSNCQMQANSRPQSRSNSPTPSEN